jgi:hypothetical protein
VAWFHPNQRVIVLHLASDREVDGIPCASGDNLILALTFHQNGRLVAGARAHRRRPAPRGTLLRFDRDGWLIYAPPYSC